MARPPGSSTRRMPARGTDRQATASRTGMPARRYSATGRRAAGGPTICQRPGASCPIALASHRRQRWPPQILPRRDSTHPVCPSVGAGDLDEVDFTLAAHPGDTAHRPLETRDRWHPSCVILSVVPAHPAPFKPWLAISPRSTIATMVDSKNFDRRRIMEARIDFQKATPIVCKVFEAMLGVESRDRGRRAGARVASPRADAGVADQRLRLLSGYALQRLTGRGETEQRIYSLDAWRETPYFSARGACGTGVGRGRY